MDNLKSRGIIGSSLSIFSAVLGIVLMCLPMLFEPPAHTIYSVFGSIFNIGEISAILGEDAIYYIIATVFMIVFALLMVAVLVLSIISLVGVCTNRKAMSMAISMRVITLVAAVVASFATMFLLLYFIVNNYTETSFGIGTILPLVASFIGIAGSWVMPSVSRLRKPVNENSTSEQTNNKI